MKSEKICISVNIPELKEFKDKYPRYTTYLTEGGKFLFDIIMRPENVVKAQAAADFGYPSVLAVAEKCKSAVEGQSKIHFNNFTKQFIGSAICALMEANGYEKTGIKKSVPHKLFTTGEFYKRNRKCQ